jgi:2,3-bisphosphoglycerate-dependent phosphoglycerate mutase
MISRVARTAGDASLRKRLCTTKASSSSSTHLPLIFLRHGQSTWNKANIFIGMTDTPLTIEGENEARLAGQLLEMHPEYSKKLDEVHTSLLRRSTHTAWLVMKELGLEWVPLSKHFALNERSYGALVGQNKKHCMEIHGKDKVKLWRRSWDLPPPPMDKSSPYWPYKDQRYASLGIPESAIPLSESLKDVTVRTSQFWDSTIVPLLRQGKRLMIVGHENNLRSIIKRLDNISESDILHVELPRAVPLVFHLDPVTLKPIPMANNAAGLSGRYLMNPAELDAIAIRDHALVYGQNTSIPVPSFTNKEKKVAERTALYSVHHNISSYRTSHSSKGSEAIKPIKQ